MTRSRQILAAVEGLFGPDGRQKGMRHANANYLINSRCFSSYRMIPGMLRRNCIT